MVWYNILCKKKEKICRFEHIQYWRNINKIWTISEFWFNVTSAPLFKTYHIMPFSKWDSYVLSIKINFIEILWRPKIWRHIQNGHFLPVLRLKCIFYGNQQHNSPILTNHIIFFQPQVSLNTFVFQNLDAKKSSL